MKKHKKTWSDLSPAEKAVIWAKLSPQRQAEQWPTLSEADRLLLIRENGRPPGECGWMMPVAPARGPVRPFMPMGVRVDAEGQEHAIETGYRGRSAARVSDVWDRMADQAARRNASAPPFTYAQVTMGREYQALVEAWASAGVRGISLEVLSQRSAGGGGEFIDAVCDQSRRIAQLRARVGPVVTLSVRRTRPSARGKRTGIPDIVLVDQVCLGWLTVAEVLKRAGWDTGGKTLDRARAALANALDRMSGAAPRYRPGHNMSKGA
ncbi:hypothetical protein HKCCE4037_06495 [Rhodobacterales bacterium HKCCE4037]|nr:hypothetical protein [Rhodobacterales bacterium HKCCE4037]